MNLPEPDRDPEGPEGAEAAAAEVVPLFRSSIIICGEADGLVRTGMFESPMTGREGVPAVEERLLPRP